MNVRASSLLPVPASPLGRGFAQLQALHSGPTAGQSANEPAPFRHSQFLRTLTHALAAQTLPWGGGNG